MIPWLSSAKQLSELLNSKSTSFPEIDLSQEIELINQLISSVEAGSSKQCSHGSGVVVGQCKNLSRLLCLDDIAYCQSSEKKVFITDVDGKVYHTAKSLRDIENNFPSLLKVNQSTLVNKLLVGEIEYKESLSYHVIKLHDNKHFRVSRRCLKKVREVFSPDLQDEQLVSKAS